jgi:hypothetical protein
MVHWKIGQWFSLELRRGGCRLEVPERISIPFFSVATICVVVYVIWPYSSKQGGEIPLGDFASAGLGLTNR